MPKINNNNDNHGAQIFLKDSKFLVSTIKMDYFPFKLNANSQNFKSFSTKCLTWIILRFETVCWHTQLHQCHQNQQCFKHFAFSFPKCDKSKWQICWFRPIIIGKLFAFDQNFYRIKSFWCSQFNARIFLFYSIRFHSYLFEMIRLLIKLAN